MLATRDGERFIAEQLVSLTLQTRPPDLVVVSDDGSQDRTLAICRDFARGAPFPVELRESAGDPALGSAFDRISASFTRGLQAVSGADLVAFCDQDDVWLTGKLERSLRELDESSSALFVFGDAALVDEQGTSLDARLSGRWPAPPDWNERDPAHQFRFGLRNPFATGATMVVRARLIDLALPVPPGWLYDRWFSLLGTAAGGSRVIREPLMHYRLHAGQTVGLDQQPEARSRWRAGSGRVGTLPGKVRRMRQLSHRLDRTALPPEVRAELRLRSLLTRR